MGKTIRELAEAVSDAYEHHQRCIHRWMGTDDIRRQLDIETEISEAADLHHEARRAFAKAAGIREDMASVIIARLVCDVADEEREAGRAATLVEVYEWMQSVGTAMCNDYDRGREADGAGEVIDAFARHFMPGTEEAAQ